MFCIFRIELVGHVQHGDATVAGRLPCYALQSGIFLSMHGSQSVLEAFEEPCTRAGGRRLGFEGVPCF